MYDSEFRLVDPRSRRSYEGQCSDGTFVVYPDGARCNVIRPVVSRSPFFRVPSNLAGVTASHLLVWPHTLELGFREPELTGATLDEARQVRVLLMSFSKLLTLTTGCADGRIFEERRWIEENLEVTRCDVHDWCWQMRAPCRVDSPERVLLAVLGKYQRWSISCLAEAWRTPAHVSGMSLFKAGDPIRAGLRAGPPRALSELVLALPQQPPQHCAHDPRWGHPELKGDPVLQFRCAGCEASPRGASSVCHRWYHNGVRLGYDGLYVAATDWAWICSRKPADSEIVSQEVLTRLRATSPCRESNRQLNRETTVSCGLRLLPKPNAPAQCGYCGTSLQRMCRCDEVRLQRQFVCVCDASLEELAAVMQADAAAAVIKRQVSKARMPRSMVWGRGVKRERDPDDNADIYVDCET